MPPAARFPETAPGRIFGKDVYVCFKDTFALQRPQAKFQQAAADPASAQFAGDREVLQVAAPTVVPGQYGAD